MKRATRLMRLAHETRGEADRWPNPTRAALIEDATQLVRLASSAAVADPTRQQMLDVFEEAAITVLVRLMTKRAHRALAKGVTPWAA